MTNNDILRRLRYILNLSDHKMLITFQRAEPEVTLDQVNSWLKREDDPKAKDCNDKYLATFLNGLIIEKRGAKDDALPNNEKSLNNNVILRKLKIAFNLKSDEALEILSLADLNLSEHEFSAFFRRTDHKHYRLCKDQVLRNFLMGLQLKLRPAEKKEKNHKQGFQWPQKPPQ
jgi:uncharacterized protein YehS (DUF1456 family)